MRNIHGEEIRVGAQAIPWGETIREQMPEILAFLAETGYRGAEIGVRHFDLNRPGYYRQLFAQHGVVPLAAHTGGTFWNKEQADAEMGNIEAGVRFAADIGCAFFVLSGNPGETAETMAASAESYTRIGAVCRDAGVQFAYHNHNWEFENGRALLKVLLGHSDAELVKLVPDIAWIHRAGLDPAKELHALGERIAYVHLKDTAGEAFCELARGEVALDAVIDTLPKLDAAWVVVEQDTTGTTPEESLRISAQYLSGRGVL